MPDGILLDNDVALKACAYRCHDKVVAMTTLCGNPPAMLSIARFTLRSRLSKASSIVDREGATAALDQLLAKVSLLSPTQEEIELAAGLEERAMAGGFEFDTGESQLIAILLIREKTLFITGDKRAIAALAGITLSDVSGRLASFEQLVAMLITKYQHGEIRQRVCAERRTDRAITACFACSASLIAAEDIFAGLASYNDHLRRNVGNMLISDEQLLAIVS